MKNRIKVQLGGITQPATDDDGVIIPDSLRNQADPWLPLVRRIQQIVGDRVMITSISTSFSGDQRSGTSHPNGWACDITFPDRIKPGKNPHLENDIYLMTYMASRLTGPLIMAFESDHVHLEVSSIMPGVYRYPTSRPSFYRNDRTNSPRVVRDEQLWLVTPTSISLVPNEQLLIKQRELTNTKLQPQRLKEALASVRI